MKRVVMGIVDTPLQADHAVRRLGEAGMSPREVSVLYPDRHGDHDFGFEAHTKAPEGALMGIGFGAILGATFTLALALAGVFPSLLALPQLGPVLAALAGATIGALFLGVAGAIAGGTVPEIEAKYYEGKSDAGSILVAVHTKSDEDLDVARAIFDEVMANNVMDTTEAALPQARA